MIDSSGDPISGRGVGCWRLMSIQARGCMLTAVHLRRDRRKEQQQQLASYMTEHDGDVVGFGDTRLGENAGIMDRLTKRAMIERREERQRQRDTSTTVGSGQQTTMTKSDASVTTPKVSWSSAGSSKNRNGAWLGGVTMAAVGEAAKRQQQEVVDCRKWGRYLGRIYRGKNKKTMVVVQVYFPDAQYSSTSKAESYSQLLGVKAAAVTQGTPAGRWRLGMAPPKPDTAQLQHPRRLLMADLETHLMHYALDPNCTLVLMGDMNIDLCTRNDDDGPALRLMWCFFSRLTFHKPKSRLGETRAHAAQMIRGGVLGKRNACLLCFLGPLVA